MTTTKEIHLFEKAGLGMAPFRIVGVEIRVGPVKVHEGNGCETWVGAPGQPMGKCDYCGEGISECWVIRSKDGREFEVGCVCVNKTGDSGLRSEMAPLKTKMRNARADERIGRARRLLESMSDVRDLLKASPHPNAHFASQGGTLLDWVRFMLEKAGRSGATKVTRIVEGALSEIYPSPK